MAASKLTGVWQASKLQRVYWGRASTQLKKEVEVLGARRVFFIASKSLATQTNEIQFLEEALGTKHAGTWFGLRPHSPREDVLSATEAARQCEADLLVSIGGGSVTDGTMAVNMCLDQNITKIEEFDGYVGNSFFGPSHWKHNKSINQISIPTTLGAGDFTHIAGVKNLSIQLKEMYANEDIQPSCVIFDPELSLHTPEWLWLSTGIRAIDHATEAICSINGHDYSTAVASGALRLLSQALPKTKENPLDLEARLQCQIGCWQAIQTLMMGVHYGGSHAIGHVLGGTAHVPHGYTSCINLPYILEYNELAIPEKCRLVADCLGASDKNAAKAMDSLIRNCGMPRTLGDVDFPMELFDKVCEYSMQNPWTACNPRPLQSPDDIAKIMTMAKNGISNREEMNELREKLML